MPVFRGNLITNEKRYKKEIITFIESQFNEKIGGYGCAIKIARMPGMFGDQVTPYETLIAVKTLELLSLL